MASAPTDTSICADRYEHPRRSMRMTKVGSMKRKRDGVNEGKEEREAEEREVQAWGKRGASVGKEGCVGMAGMPYPPNLCTSVQSVGEYLASETSVVSVASVGR